MRKLLASLLIISFNAYAVAPTAINGEKVTPKVYAQDVLLPNYQATKLAGLDTRIETGNTNLLINPSFEHGTPSTGWTLTNATSAVTLIDFTDGKKGLTVTPTVAGGGIKQVSTLYAAKIIGGQGVAQISVKTAGSDVKVCPLINESRPTDVAKFCVAVPVSSTSVVFPEAIVPFILDGTSNGIEIYSTNTTAFTIDEAFVGKAAPFASNSNVSNWTSYTPTLTGFGTATAIEFQYRQVGGNYEIRGKFTPGTSTATEARISLPLSATSASSSIIPSISLAGTFVNNTIESYEGSILIEPSVSYMTLGKQGAGTAGLQKLNGNSLGTTAITLLASVPIAGLEQAGKVYSQASQDYAYTNAGTITIGATTTAPTKGTIVTDRVMASRKGQRLNAIYQYEQSVAGVAGSGDYLFSLPSGLSFDSSVVNFYTGDIGGNASQPAAPKAKIGEGWISVAPSARGHCDLFAYDSTRFRAACIQAFGSLTYIGTAAYSLANGNYGFSFNVDAPIQGWQDYGVIVGSFAGLEKCANDYECTDTFSAQVSSTGVVTAENIDWISGNCTLASPSVCTLNAFLKDGSSGLSSAMNCVVSGSSGLPRVFNIASSTTAIVSIQESLGSTNGNITLDTSFALKCQKGTNDYKPKTAKIASSVGVPTVPGLAGTSLAVDTFSVSFGTTNATTVCSASPCSYLDQIGTAVSSVTRSALGFFSANTVRTYSKLKWQVIGQQAGGAYHIIRSAGSCSNCNAATFEVANNIATANVDIYGTIIFQGSY